MSHKSPNNPKSENDLDSEVLETLISTRRWIIGLVGLWGVALGATVTTLSESVETIIPAVLIMIAWIGLPIAIVRDGRRVAYHTDWSPLWPLYTFLSLIPGWALVVGMVYLYRRQTNVVNGAPQSVD